MSLARLFELTWTGIRYRLFRSLMTVLVITVAIAFVVNMVLGALNARVAREAALERLEALKMAPRWAARISQPATPEGLLREIVAAEPGSGAYREALLFGGLDDAQGREIRRLGAQALDTLDFLRGLNYRERREIASPDVELAFLERIADPGERDAFYRRVDRFRNVQLPFERAGFDAFLEAWPQAAAAVERVVQGRNAAVRSLAPLFRERSPLAALREADGPFGERLRQAGFHLPEDTARQLAAEAALETVSLEIEASLSETPIRQALATRLDILPSAVVPSLLWELARKPEDARWFAEAYRQRYDPDADWTPETLARVAERSRREAKLLKVEQRTLEAEASAGHFGLSPKLSVLLVVSLMVCGVGIANALLMSVTERYREIATLKCLGALDGSILWIFIMEAALQGVVGGLAGSAAGAVISVLRAILGYGSIYLESPPLAAIGLVFVLAILLGALLAAAASIYPAWKAARLAPLEAMRIE